MIKSNIDYKIYYLKLEILGCGAYGKVFKA